MNTLSTLNTQLLVRTAGPALNEEGRRTQLRLATDAGRLLRFGLMPDLQRSNTTEFAEVVEVFQGSSEFREIVRAYAVGLGLTVVDVDQRGVVLAAMAESPFAMRPADLRAYTSADERLIDGIIQVAIAATVYPRAAMLEEDPSLARPPITTMDVERTLRDLEARLAADAAATPDPSVVEAKAGLIEAWRVLAKRPGVRYTPDQRRVSRTTTGMIDRNFESLIESGCFTRTRRGDQTVYQPTWRYQTHMQEFGGSALFDLITTMLAAIPATAPSPIASTTTALPAVSE
jgi:hypothetical protein